MCRHMLDERRERKRERKREGGGGDSGRRREQSIKQSFMGKTRYMYIVQVYACTVYVRVISSKNGMFPH